MTRDPEGAYSQLVRLQEGAAQSEDTQTSDNDIDKTVVRSVSRKSSTGRSLSRGPSVNRPFSLSYVVPGPFNVYDAEEEADDEEEVIEKRKEVSMKRLAYLNKPELPVLIIGSIAASVQGVIFPIFALLLSSSINMFFKPPKQLEKDSRFWALVYVGLGCVSLIALPGQSYFFGVAGGKLIERIRSLTFEKVVYQQISWFDEPGHSRCVE